MRKLDLSGLLENKEDTCQVFCYNKEIVNRLKLSILDVEGFSELFKVLSDQTRLNIVYALSKEELCVCDLSLIAGMSIPATSHHLRVLRNLKIVNTRKDGKIVFYSLSGKYREILNYLVEKFSANLLATDLEGKRFNEQEP